METVNIVPRCKQCGKHPHILTLSVSHEGTHSNLYIETICIICSHERTITWSLEQLAYYAFKLLDAEKKVEEDTVPGSDEVN